MDAEWPFAVRMARNCTTHATAQMNHHVAHQAASRLPPSKADKVGVGCVGWTGVPSNATPRMSDPFCSRRYLSLSCQAPLRARPQHPPGSSSWGAQASWWRDIRQHRARLNGLLGVLGKRTSAVAGPSCSAIAWERTRLPGAARTPRNDGICARGGACTCIRTRGGARRGQGRCAFGGGGGNRWPLVHATLWACGEWLIEIRNHTQLTPNNAPLALPAAQLRSKVSAIPSDTPSTHRVGAHRSAVWQGGGGGDDRSHRQRALHACSMALPHRTVLPTHERWRKGPRGICASTRVTAQLLHTAQPPRTLRGSGVRPRALRGRCACTAQGGARC